jgi:hypothetical protein
MINKGLQGVGGMLATGQYYANCSGTWEMATGSCSDQLMRLKCGGYYKRK